MNFIINENKKTRELIMNQFSKLENQIQQLNKKFDINNINNQQELKGIKNGYNWRYVGQVVNGLREGKGIEYYNDGDRYEVIGEMIKKKEKEFIIGIMVIDMKVIGKMINGKDKEYIIIKMVIEKWEII